MPVKPAWQLFVWLLRQAALDVLAMGDVTPQVQFVHDAVPAVSLYLPPAHAVQLFPEGHVVSVKSTPFDMMVIISSVARSVIYSSTINSPAMLPWKYCLLAVFEDTCTVPKALSVKPYGMPI